MSDEIRAFTTEELAEDAFLKQERLLALLTMNTPTDFEERKKAFIAVAVAREAANKAKAALDARVSRSITSALPNSEIDTLKQIFKV